MKNIQPYILPLAIVIAGVLISGTIYMSQNKSGSTENGKNVAEIARNAMKPKIDVHLSQMLTIFKVQLMPRQN